MEFSTKTLSNGIRIIHKQTDGVISHCGIIINTGSRDEDEKEQGLAHFIEHVIFKGTKKRKAYHILSRIDVVGGELNAYTSKEETCFYASFLTQYYERSVELLSDIMFNSVFPEKEIEKEKTVVIDEINSYLDNPSEQIFDDFEEMLFPNHSLGRNILGTPESVKSFNKKHIDNFIKRNYTADKIVFSSVGNMKAEEVFDIAEKYLSSVTPANPGKERVKPKNIKPFKTKVERQGFQSHCIIGSTSAGYKSKYKTPLILLNNILGGPAMNSRLNLSIRERHGYTYNLESNYNPYTDSGTFTVYLGTDPKTVERCIELVNKELRLLCEKKLTTQQLKQAKQQLIGHIALSQESRINLMLAMGKSILTYNKVESLSVVYRKVHELTSEVLIEAANKYMVPEHQSLLIFNPQV